MNFSHFIYPYIGPGLKVIDILTQNLFQPFAEVKASVVMEAHLVTYVWQRDPTVMESGTVKTE